ncbi:MAG: tetratricopeptide repeat protein [Verrucomicrobiales bacterium]|nr:tetratricopeptide repeat protein [Verrucomicrobiales bacterium]
MSEPHPSAARGPRLILLGSLLLLLLCPTPRASAQAPEPAPADAPAAPTPKEFEGLDLQTLFEKNSEFMENSQWEYALMPLNVIIADYGEDAMDEYGPMFGVMYYRQGFCLKNLKKFEEALTSYEKCYNDFANKPDTEPAKKNPVWELCRLEMGIVNQALGRYDKAVEDYEAFARQPAAAGTYDEVGFRIQAAACYAKAGKADRARQLIEGLFKLTGNAAPRADALFRAMLTLTEDWANNNSEPAKAEKEAHQFLDLYAGKVAVSPFDMARFQFNERVLGIAQKASGNDQNTLAIRLLTHYASASNILRDLEKRAIDMAPNVPQALTNEIAKYRAMLTSPDSRDWLALLLLAACHERLGNQAAAFAIYQHCLNEVPKHPNREIILFGAMRCAMALRHMDFAQHLGTVFRTEFPDSKYAAVVNTMMLESLFFSQHYDEALELANRVRDAIPEDDPNRDLATFVIGASLFNLNRIADAVPELEEHTKKYPDSRFKEYVRYFLAASFQREKNWEKSGELLDKFIADFPQSDYLSFALMDRASCHFQLGQYDSCMARLGQLQKQFPQFPNLDVAISMRGDSHLMLNNNTEAEAAYLKARELAIEAGPSHAVILGRILLQLIRTSKALQKQDQIIQFYDEYMKDHTGGYYDAEVIVGSMEALQNANRGEEALAALEKVIIRLGSGEPGPGIEEAIGSYTEHGIAVMGAEKLYAKLENFVPQGTEVNETLRAWLLMARIDLLQNDAYKDQFPKRAAQIQVAFEELRGFDPKTLPTYIVTQVGRNLAEQDSTEARKVAVDWFDEVIRRGDSEFYPLALMGRARIIASEGGPSAMKEAIAAFDRVVRELPDKPDYVEEALVSKARLYYDKEMWKEASDVFFEIQKNPKFVKFRPEVFFKLGRAYQEQGKTEDALSAFTPFVGPPLESYVDYSAEARVRAAQIQEQRDNKEKAFRLIKDTVSRMYKFSNHPVAGPWVEKAKELYKKLRDETGAQPDPDEGIWGIR